jgi:hypothetical protein
MFNRIFSAIALLVLSIGALAADVSVTTFSGSGQSGTYTNGGHSDVTAYAGSTAAIETGPGVISVSGTLYSGSTTDSGSFQEISGSQSTFHGTSTNDGLVGRTVQYQETFTVSGGVAQNHSTANESGFFGEFSAVGNGFNGTVGVEGGVYSDSSYENSYTVYGSNSYAETYSTSSYDL